MAALPYMQLYVADYLADTMHLNTEEHGAYLLLIFNYWQTGKPLLAKSERLATVARMSIERWRDVEDVLKQFFIERDGLWVHPRIEADLDHVSSIQEKASRAGKASALARKRKQEVKTNARSTDVSTDVERTHQHGRNHTDPDPYPNTKKEKIKDIPAKIPFADFYQKYPIKKSKAAAEKTWKRLKLEDQEKAINGIAVYMKANDPNFYVHPSTYLNGRRWEDEPVSAKNDSLVNYNEYQMLR